ncbi:MAG: hypothetical protein FJ388_14740 [Verrucomicrobia bacterium]|nr:hypothetical protein [Verrucomicrobiota bacterium]
MTRQFLIKAAAVGAWAVALGWLALQADLSPKLQLQRDIVILNDGVNDDGMLGMLQTFLTKRFGLPVRIRTNFVDLSAAHRPERRQWDYSVMLAAVLDRVRGTGRCVLLTGKDTFGSGLNWSTGIARCNGTTAVVSVCRLNPAFWGEAEDRGLHHKRARKIVLHELGHTFGRSNHCHDWNCVLHGSNSIGEIDQTGEDYCARCDAIARAVIAVIRKGS